MRVVSLVVDVGRVAHVALQRGRAASAALAAVAADALQDAAVDRLRLLRRGAARRRAVRVVRGGGGAASRQGLQVRCRYFTAALGSGNVGHLKAAVQ